MGVSMVTSRGAGRRSIGANRTPTVRAVCESPSARQCLHPRRYEAHPQECEQIRGAAPPRPLPPDLLQPPQPKPDQSPSTHLTKERLYGATTPPIDGLPETDQQLPLHPVSGRGMLWDASLGTAPLARGVALAFTFRPPRATRSILTSSASRQNLSTCANSPSGALRCRLLRSAIGWQSGHTGWSRKLHEGTNLERG